MLSTPLTKSLLHTTDNYIKALEKAGFKTVGDLLNHFPREYEDRTNVLDSFSLINIKEKNTILVTLVSITSQKTGGGKLLTKAVLEDKNGFLSEAVWFNRKYLATQLNLYTQKKVIVSGKVKYAFGKVTFQSPEVETDLSKVAGEIVPVYPELNYIPSKWLVSKIELLKKYIKPQTSPQPSPLRGEGVAQGVEETLPDSIVQKYNFISRAEAIYKIHFPKNKHDIEEAKHRLAYEELFDINYKALTKKHEGFKLSEGKSRAIQLDAELVKTLISDLPFELTDKQKIVLFQILKDMEKTHAMARLLEGDVGTGKTIVAVLAAMHGVLRSRSHPSKESSHSVQLGQELQTSPQPSPLEEREQEHSVRKLELKSPGYVFDLAKEFRQHPTNSEEKLWGILRNNNLENIKFRRQHPIGRYIADFYSEELRLIIELDGKIHDEKVRKEYDEERENLLRNYGFEIIRFKNEDILNNSEDYIYDALRNSPLLQRRGARGEVINVRGGNPEGGVKTKGDSIQVAIMAPTEILARQHFESTQELLMKYGISSHLLVGSTTKKQKEAVKTDLKNGQIDIVFGTHALVQEDVIFNNLGLVVIDEQHRFGVRQRDVLESGLGNRSGLIPHSLNMTATPIPRTLALTLYGDQDLSIINEYPKGRKDIFTKVIKNEEERHQVELFIRTELEKGRQIFWISPLVEESEKIDLANAIATYESLVDIFSPYKVGLLHGKMSAKEKESTMRDFSENKIQILSSTSVVEVGVDVPNSTIMCIEGAERFGLSQLHQFRGRVGRGAYQSYCYLFPSKGNYTDRLRAMERTNNGFELAEIDLELRGPGEVYGVRQSGVPDLKVADLRDLDLISQIREDIESLLSNKLSSN
ncbi:MAG: DUF559 domain-containing protein [Candidatus Gracilibacteria bacterium]|nr:DUF559 domain-containing protein [Candidatus Gracilibacteria bacterium]